MSEQNLLDIVPDQLFQSHSINEIDHVQKKLQYEIERKREELRAMVGERYRDLICAADTIEEMKGTISSTFQHIVEMTSACRNLHETHLVGFKIDERPPTSDRVHIATNVNGIAVQIKLLFELPEKIWNSIEKEDYITATRLFILARHINTGLQLHSGNKSLGRTVAPLQPLVERQWSSISNFNDTIVRVCRQKLQDISISKEVACSSLLSLYLLDSNKSLVDLLNTFVSLHSNGSLKETLAFDLSMDTINSNIKEQIKDKIINSLRVILKTIELIYSCFVEGEGGALIGKLNELYRSDSPPLMQLIHFSDQRALNLLPSVISNYRLTPNKDVQPLAKDDITKCVHSWSSWVKQFIDEKVKELLKNITNAKVLQQIRDEAFKTETPANWSDICSSLAMPNVDVWSHYFQPLITARVKHIIDAKWSQVLTTFQSQILMDLSRVSGEEAVDKEADVNWFVWKDLIGETVIESRADVIDVMNSLMKGMWLQDRGFTPTLEKMCQNLDNELLKLLQDLNIYLCNGTNSGSDKINDNLLPYEDDESSKHKFNDKCEILLYLREVSKGNISSMLQFIKDECFGNPALQATELQRKTTSVYTARFIHALVHLMPSLRRCFVPDTNGYEGYSTQDEGVKAWNELCSFLKESRRFCWGKWIDIVMTKVQTLTAGLPQEFTLEANVDYLLVQWDNIKIEEKDEEGKPVESLIKIPSGASLKLQEYLYSVSRILDEVVPHTLPAEVHTEFIERITDITLTHYCRVIREKEMDINQKCALQLLMDIRHLTLLLVSRENTKAMDCSQDICEFLRQKIDPFDYDVFYPYIQTNLKRSVQRVQTIFGSLILHQEQLASIVGARVVASGGSADKTPALLTMAAPEGALWFSLLPVTAPVSLQKKADKTRKKVLASPSPSKSTKNEISELMSNSLPINLATARSGAASFFNSMTSDWFSGS